MYLWLFVHGSREFRDKHADLFRVTWGSLHPNYIDIDFARHVFRKNPYMLLTSDWPYDVEKIRQWDGRSQQIGECRSGYELLIIAKPNIEI